MIGLVANLPSSLSLVDFELPRWSGLEHNASFVKVEDLVPDVKFECALFRDFGLSARRENSFADIVNMRRYQPMFQHATPVDVPYKVRP